MASYAVAHLKLAFKLGQTGYRHARGYRLNVYLTNSLEPPSDRASRNSPGPSLPWPKRLKRSVLLSAASDSPSSSGIRRTQASRRTQANQISTLLMQY